MNRGVSVFFSAVLLGFLWVGSAAHAQEIEMSRSTLNGRWVVIENGEDPAAMLEIDDTTILAVDSHNGERMVFQYLPESSSSTHHVMQMVEGGDTVDLHWLLQNPNQGIVWMAGDDDLVITRRIGEMHPDLLGQWMVGEPDSSGSEINSATIDTKTMIIRDGATTRQVDLLALTPLGSSLEVLGIRPTGDAKWFLFEPLPEGGFIVWQMGDDDYVVFYRADAQPEWLFAVPH